MHDTDRRPAAKIAQIVRDASVIPHPSSRIPRPAPIHDGSRPLGVLELTTIRMDLVEVSASGSVLGYMELVGIRFVALVGPRYDLAIESGQFLRLQDAVDAITTSTMRA